MKYFIIAGEASGDLHGSHLMASLASKDEEAQFSFWGGDMMNAVQPSLLKHYRELAFMGFAEVVMNINTIRKNFALCKEQISAFAPDALILIDYPGFNLRMAEWAKKKGMTVYYYISPQLWAWKSKRIEKIKKFVDRLFVILPFEKTYFEDRGVSVSYYGHPLLNIIDDYRAANPIESRNAAAILPGSRKQEISKILPRMIQGAMKSNVDKFYISKAPAIPESFYQQYMPASDRFELYEGSSYELLNQSSAALVTSGTATLECALFDVPEVVCYYGSSLSYQIAKRLVNIKYIALANLIVDREIIKELIQHDCHPDMIAKEFNKLYEEEHRKTIKSGYKELRKRLRTDETSSVPQLIANEIIERLTT